MTSGDLMKELKKQLEENERHLEESWQKLFRSQGLDVDQGAICVMGELLKEVVQIPRRYKTNIVFSQYARPNELAFADISMIVKTPTLDITKFRQPQGELKCTHRSTT